MNERNGFLKLLAENEDDATTRLVYVDWLDEHGEHEEADRQRKWPAAKEWLVRFCEQNNPAADEEDPYEWIMSYEVLIASARTAVEEDSEWIGVECGNNMSMCSALETNSKEFWKNFSIITGIPLPPNVETKSGFGCSC